MESRVRGAAAETLFRPAFALIWLYSLVSTLAWAMLIPVLPLFMRGPLGAGDIAVGVLVSGAFLAAAAVQPLLGRLADRRGRRLLLLGGPVVFATFVALFSLVEAPGPLFALRAAAAIGDAAFVVGAITVVNDLAPEGRRGEAYSVYSISVWAGMGLGPVLGDLVLHTLSYDAVWLVCAGLALSAAVLALFLPETRRGPAARRPSGRLFTPSAVIPGLVVGLEMFGFAALLVFTPLYAQELGMRGAGLVLLANAAVLLAMRIFGRKLPDRLGARRSATAGVLFAVAGLTVPALVAHPGALYLGAALFGAGHALLYPAVFMLAVGLAAEDERSAALGSLKASEALGFAIGSATLGVIASLTSYSGVFAFAAVATLGGLLPLLVLRARQRAVVTPAAPAPPAGAP
jgi:MFS family permease